MPKDIIIKDTGNIIDIYSNISKIYIIWGENIK